MSKELCEATIANTIPDILANIKITTLAEMGYPQVLHISDNPHIDKFTPAVPYRATRDQDHRLPRICTSTGLAGCIIGYNGLSHDFMERTWEDPKFLGGYVIYSFKPDVVVTPSIKILGDQEITDEQWVVSYDPATATYTPSIIGKMFLANFAMERGEKADPDEDDPTTTCVNYIYTLFLEVYPGQIVHWNKSTVLEPGYYKIKTINLMSAPSCDNFNTFSIEPIEKVDYLMIKQTSAGLLSAEYPQSLKW